MAIQNNSYKTYYRFSLFQRVMHFMVMIGFLGLSVTGLGLAFSSYSVPRAVIWLMGGQDSAAFLHRFFAVITFLPVIIHAIWFLYYKFVLGKKFTDTDTILFQFYDLRHIKENFLYFFGKREDPPEFYRYTYLQKLHYWPIFFGLITMGITGVLMMYPTFFVRFLPGYFINIAQILHFWEALLAITIKVFFHALVEHIRPSVFPMDKSIFTGELPVSVMEQEHSGELNLTTDNTE